MADRRARPFAVALFLVALAVIALLTRTGPASSHEWSRLGTIDSIVERGSYDLETSRFHGTTDKIFFNGHFYSHQPPLLPTLEAPVYWVLRRFGLQFWNSAPFDLAYYLFTLLTNGVAFALTVVIVARSLILLGIAQPWSSRFALLLPLATWLLPYAVVSNNHGISAMLLALIAHLLLSISLRGATIARAAWLGLSLGLIAAIEVVPLVTFVPLTCGFVWRRADMKRMPMLAAFGLGLLLPLVAHAILNLPLTGDLRPGGFHSELFDYAGSKFTSETLTGSFNHASVRGLLAYMWRAMFAEKGYFTFAPLLLVGLLIGIVESKWRMDARDARQVLLWGSVTSLGVSLAMTNNFGGAAVGFRHATFLCPVLLVLLAPVLAESRSTVIAARAAIGGLALASAVVLLAFAVPQPWSDLRLPPPSAAASWRDYVPVIAYVLNRTEGTVDEFGRPLGRAPD